MKMTIESTTRLVEADGVKCRVWDGKTEGGVEVTVLVPRIAVKADQDNSVFIAELEEHAAPSDAADIFPLRMIL